MRAEMLTSILSELNGTSADIEASGVISTDGLMMAAVLPQNLDEDRVGAMSAAMLSLGDRTAQELSRGTLGNQITMSPSQTTKLSLIFDVKRAAETIAGLI